MNIIDTLNSDQNAGAYNITQLQNGDIHNMVMQTFDLAAGCTNAVQSSDI